MKRILVVLVMFSLPFILYSEKKPQIPGFGLLSAGTVKENAENGGKPWLIWKMAA